MDHLIYRDRLEFGEPVRTSLEKLRGLPVHTASMALEESQVTPDCPEVYLKKLDDFIDSLKSTAALSPYLTRIMRHPPLEWVVEIRERIVKLVIPLQPPTSFYKYVISHRGGNNERTN